MAQCSFLLLLMMMSCSPLSMLLRWCRLLMPARTWLDLQRCRHPPQLQLRASGSWPTDATSRRLPLDAVPAPGLLWPHAQTRCLLSSGHRPRSRLTRLQQPPPPHPCSPAEWTLLLPRCAHLASHSATRGLYEQAKQFGRVSFLMRLDGMSVAVPTRATLHLFGEGAGTALTSAPSRKSTYGRQRTRSSSIEEERGREKERRVRADVGQQGWACRRCVRAAAAAGAAGTASSIIRRKRQRRWRRRRRIL